MSPVRLDWVDSALPADPGAPHALTQYSARYTVGVVHRLVKIGDNRALILTQEMIDHLGVEEAVLVSRDADRIVLRRPLTLSEAANLSDERFGEAYKKLAE